ncbi:hypothetical protein ACIQI7_22030 [Kitasatospora sp. NPDC092039]|uniref:hypothetical protein n=1 Tax=Kitasatospora sp. NPDC092039 TaxID=3364086 RepID=UPI0038017245
MLSFELTCRMQHREPVWGDPAAFQVSQQSGGSGFSRRSAPAPGQPFTPSAPRPSYSLRWLVTMATTTTDGRAGTQTFVVDAPTSREALAEAHARLRTPVAVAHRRGAAIDPASAVAEDWRSWGRAQAAGWEGTG